MNLFNIQLPDWPMWKSQKKSVILVEDNASDAILIERALLAEGFDVVTCATSEEALGVLHANGRQFVMVLADVSLGQSISGWQLRHHVQARWPSVTTVIITGAVENLRHAPRGELVFTILKCEDMQPAIRGLKQLIM